MPEIHPTAIVDPSAEIGRNVSIGPYSVIESDCVIGDDCVIDAHVKIARYTTVGARSRIYFGAVIGEDPQDHRFVPGVRAFTRIGEDVTLREYVMRRMSMRGAFEARSSSVGWSEEEAKATG